MADSQGNWTCTPPTSLPAGTHTINVVVTDPDTSEVATFGPYTVIVPASEGVNSGSTSTPSKSNSNGNLALANTDSVTDAEDDVAVDTKTSPTNTDDDVNADDVDKEISPSNEVFNWWPLLLSVGGGLLILAIIVGVLRSRYVSR
jgi:hypothetical protein